MKLKSFKNFLVEGVTTVLAYHGSPNQIDEFKYEFTNKGNDQLGSGFYFTTDVNEARGYGHNIHKVELTFKNSLDADKIGNITYNTAFKFIQGAPDLDHSLSNWGDVEYEGKSKVMRTAAEGYVSENENIVRSLFHLANDFYPNHVKEFNENIFKILKYDSIFKKHENGATHYVAFFPSQIKILKDSE